MTKTVVLFEKLYGIFIVQIYREQKMNYLWLWLYYMHLGLKYYFIRWKYLPLMYIHVTGNPIGIVRWKKNGGPYRLSNVILVI